MSARQAQEAIALWRPLLEYYKKNPRTTTMMREKLKEIA